jgi:hypothetical protein
VKKDRQQNGHKKPEILLKVALKTTDCHDITEILLKVALKTTDCHDITEILLKVALKTITPFLKTLVKSPSFAHCIVCPSSIYR